MKTLKEHIVYEDFEVVIRFDGRDKIWVGPDRDTIDEWYLPNTFDHHLDQFIPWLVERGVKRPQLSWVLFKIHGVVNQIRGTWGDLAPLEWELTEEDIEKWLPKELD